MVANSSNHSYMPKRTKAKNDKAKPKKTTKQKPTKSRQSVSRGFNKDMFKAFTVY